MKFSNLPIQKEIQRFNNHLRNEDNERIILSGIFGIGKTYFIDKFFKMYSDEYLQIQLNPLNYSVSQNEDIFQLIKYDIAFQLLAHNDLNLEEIKFDSRTYSEYFLAENFKSVITDVIRSLSKIDQRVDAIVAPSLDLAKRIEKEKTNIEVDDKATLTQFLQTFTSLQGSIREEDNITILINHLIEGLKNGKSPKKLVLTIDDLDRIDPEHIFRILNVFSAHFDFMNGQNKFDFDQVILICDIENIRGIFHSKYGTDVDFSGYIDKFYSQEVFYYDFSQVISDHLLKFLYNIQIEDDYIQKQLTSLAPDVYLRDELSFVLKHMIFSNAVSMRMLVNFLKAKIELKNRSVEFDSYRVYYRTTSIFILFDILERLFGGEIHFIAAIDKTIKRFPYLPFQPYDAWLDLRVGNLLMVINYMNTQLKPSQEIEKYIDEPLDIQASYRVLNSSNGLVGRTEEMGSMQDELTWENNIDHPVNQFKKKNFPYFQLLKKAYIAKKEFCKD